MSYLRFQTSMRCRNTARALGIFKAAGRLEEEDRQFDYARDSLRTTLEWFNDNLTVPNRDSIPWKSLFWFDCRKQELIGRAWELAAWLYVHDVFVTTQRCHHPGQIVYRDEQQIAAIPDIRLRKRLRLK